MRGVRDECGRLDERLALLAREEAALRLRLGQALEVLGGGGFFELGFSSLSAYALERCDRSVRWVEAARCLARRVEGLPELRRAIAAGAVSWSMADLVARVAQPEDESRWLEAAEGRTVRQMRVLVAKAVAAGRDDALNRAMGLGVEDQTRGAEPRTGAGVRGGDCGHGAGRTHENGCANENGGELDGIGVHAGSGAYEGCDVGDGDESADGDSSSLTCNVDREEAWLFESTRLLLRRMGVRDTDAQCEALLAEGQGTLLAALPEGALDLERLERSDAEHQRWSRHLSYWRVEAEVESENHFCGLLWTQRDRRFRLDAVDGAPARDERHPERPRGQEYHPRAAQSRSAVAVAAAGGLASLAKLGWSTVDARVRELSRALAQHELEAARLVARLYRAGGWRRLGYATAAQYARERLGWSASSLRGRRALALRLEKLPRVAAALGAGEIGVEAALQVVRVATSRTQAAWVERARRRTVKHLREEIVAAQIAVRCSGEVDCVPPADAEMDAFQELERAVVSGRACSGRVSVANDTGAGDDAPAAEANRRLAEPTSEPRRAWFVMLGSLAGWLDRGLQLSAGWLGGAMGPAEPARAVGSRGGEAGAAGRGGLGGEPGAGRIALRLRMSRRTCVWWRGLEAQAQRWLPKGMSWLRFLCLSMWQAWRHLLGSDAAYSEIYERDCYRCLNPVCGRRDVTPHHLTYRSAGGADIPVNVGSLCTWCHLWGVHGGRIRATGTVPRILWELGSGHPCLVVYGRERLVA